MADRSRTGRLTRRGALTAGIGLAVGGFLTACSRDTGTGGSGPISEGELVLGVNLELTGTGSAFGKLQQRALKITLDEVNVSGVRIGDAHRRVRLITEDNGGDAAAAAKISSRLIDRGVSAVIGGMTAETCFAMIKVAEERRVPLLAMAGADDVALPLVTRKFTYKLAPNASDIARVLAQEIQRQELATVSVLATADTIGNDGVKALNVSLRAIRTDPRHSNVLDTVQIPRSGQDIAGAVARVADGEPAAVIVWATAPISGQVVHELRGSGYRGAIFLDPGAVTDDTLTGPYREAMEGAYVCYPAVLGGAPFLANTPSARTSRTFINRYAQEYGSFSGFAPYASDAVLLVAAAARRSNTTDPRRLRGSLEAVPYEGVAGAYAFSPIDHGGLASDVLTIFNVRGGAWIRHS